MISAISVANVTKFTRNVWIRNKIGSAMIDDFDQAILDLVTENNQLTHSEIGRRVSLSPSSVRRRLVALRKSGVISQDVSILNTDRIGLTFIVHVHTNIGTSGEDQAFRHLLQNDPAISQAYSVSGDADYVLLVHAESSSGYEIWSERNLLANASVSKFTSTLVWSRTKSTQRIIPCKEASKKAPSED